MRAKTTQSPYLSSRHWVGGIALVLALTLLAAIGKPTSTTDADRGKTIFEKRCTGCHALDIDKEGPRLSGVFGRAAGSVPTFAYSDAIKKSGVSWDAASLDKWLIEPAAFIPDSNMAFRVVDAGERSAIIAYLKQLSGK
jgi:cytochrome c